MVQAPCQQALGMQTNWNGQEHQTVPSTSQDKGKPHYRPFGYLRLQAKLEREVIPALEVG